MSKKLKYRGDYIGMRFGSLVVVAYPVYGKQNVRMGGAFCSCDCGGEEFVSSMGKLFRGRVTCCRLCRKDKTREKRIAYYAERRKVSALDGGPLYKERLYHIWNGMKTRCGSIKGYEDVSVCDEWLDYTVFREWAYCNGYDENAPRGECTIDRVNPYGNYEPSNCRFVDMKTQFKNKRKNWDLMSDEERTAQLATVTT